MTRIRIKSDLAVSTVSNLKDLKFKNNKLLKKNIFTNCSVMREERETLLTLLEAFVYDPLVDWTTGITGI